MLRIFHAFPMLGNVAFLTNSHFFSKFALQRKLFVHAYGAMRRSKSARNFVSSKIPKISVVS